MFATAATIDTLRRSGESPGVSVVTTGSIRPTVVTICRMQADLEDALIRAIRAKMAGLGISQRALAAATGIPVRTMTNYFGGHSTLRMNHIAAIAPIIGMQPAELVAYAQNEWAQPPAPGSPDPVNPPPSDDAPKIKRPGAQLVKAARESVQTPTPARKRPRRAPGRAG